MMNMRDKRLSLSLSPIALSSGGGRESTKPPLRSYDNESNIHEDIKITFTLPSGELFEETVKNGETVQEIKRRLYSADKIPTNSHFYFNGKDMLDPLSLNDIPGVNGCSALQIEVKVPGTSNTEPVRHSSREEGGQKDGLTSSDTSIQPTTHNTIHQQQQPTDNSITEQNPNAEFVYSGNGKDEKSETTKDIIIQPPTESTTPTTPTTPEKTTTTTTYTPNTIISANFVDQDTSSPNSQSTIPSLPHAAFDDNEPLPPTPKEPKSKHSEENDTTIDVKDDGEEKKIETLGGGRRTWKLCYLV